MFINKKCINDKAKNDGCNEVSLLSIIKSTFLSPTKAYIILQNKKSIYHFGAAYSVALIMFLFVFFCASEPFIKNQGLSLFDLSALVFFIPLLFAVPIMHVHLVATTMGGKGAFFDFYKLVLWSFIPLFAYYLFLYFVAFIIAMIAGIVYAFFFYLLSYAFVLMFYFVLSLSVSMSISKKKSLFVYILCIATLSIAIKLLIK